MSENKQIQRRGIGFLHAVFLLLLYFKLSGTGVYEINVWLLVSLGLLGALLQAAAERTDRK